MMMGNGYMRDERILREHQLTLLEMLKEIDRICNAHQIRYALFAGSALGAVGIRALFLGTMTWMLLCFAQITMHSCA